MRKIGFGGGCHWCTEAVFQHVPGVVNVEQGWIASDPPFDAFSEAVIVHYDDSVSLEKLTHIHLETHSSKSKHPLREKYRSAIYYFNEKSKETAEQFIMQKAPDAITMLLPFRKFKLNKETYLNYFQKNPENAFCQRYIEPKLRKLSEMEMNSL
ncbi:peptide-methionine (S)-S-oxide reductase [Portibacter marinus]|uniref:peptide-methionine (S)-S-oxide reductase n=1 Tax=Portibacter marinus TaxID=2898660 RepID=UPI001F489495|nr:peptide-methionine (S)-S-oxide reductase [Portibacter marinus]